MCLECCCTDEKPRRRIVVFGKSVRFLFALIPLPHIFHLYLKRRKTSRFFFCLNSTRGLHNLCVFLSRRLAHYGRISGLKNKWNINSTIHFQLKRNYYLHINIIQSCFSRRSCGVFGFAFEQ